MSNSGDQQLGGTGEELCNAHNQLELGHSSLACRKIQSKDIFLEWRTSICRRITGNSPGNPPFPSVMRELGARNRNEQFPYTSIELSTCKKPTPNRELRKKIRHSQRFFLPGWRRPMNETHFFVQHPPASARSAQTERGGLILMFKETEPYSEEHLSRSSRPGSLHCLVLLFWIHACSFSLTVLRQGQSVDLYPKINRIASYR